LWAIDWISSLKSSIVGKSWWPLIEVSTKTRMYYDRKEMINQSFQESSGLERKWRVMEVAGRPNEKSPPVKERAADATRKSSKWVSWADALSVMAR